MLEESTISKGARAFRALLLSHAQLKPIRIYIGIPANHIKKNEIEPKSPSLNLFFYHIQYANYPVHAKKEDPVYVRLHCLVTAFTGEEPEEQKKETPDPGEMDLRLLGHVMQAVHNKPFIELQDASALLEIVPSSLAPDEINKLWSTQADTPYRASLAYELALLPIPPLSKRKEPRLVSNLGLRVKHNLDIEPLPKEGFGLKPRRLRITPFTIDTKRPDWRPCIFFVDENGHLQRSTELEYKSSLEKVKVVIFGEKDSLVTLRWKQWAEDKWTELTDTDTEQHKAIGDRYSLGDKYKGVEVQLPSNNIGQLLMRAEREYMPLDAKPDKPEEETTLLGAEREHMPPDDKPKEEPKKEKTKKVFSDWILITIHKRKEPD